MNRDILILIAYHFIFFNGWYRNPWKLCTSEIASLWFPFLTYAKGRILFKDPIYFPYPACMPVLSSFYFPQLVVGYIQRFMSLDSAFRLFSYFIFSHYLIASIIAYKVMGLFGAITLTYAAYSFKPQTPSAVFTVCWMPGMLVGGWFGAFSCFMAVTAGYWPILVYFMPVAAIANVSCLWGLIPSLSQIIPFLWYWPKSVRSGQKVDKKQGILPSFKLWDLLWPSNSTNLVSGVHYPEAEMYMGLAVLFIWHPSVWWIPALICILILDGFLPSIQRIPLRSLYLLTFSITAMASQRIYSLNIVLLQAFLLLRNSSIYPSFPFSEWWNKPSKMYANIPLTNQWPHFTGYIQGKSIDVYRGSFRLKEHA